MLANARGNIDRFRAMAVYSCPTPLEIKYKINELKYASGSIHQGHA